MQKYFLAEQRVDGTLCSDRIPKIQDFKMYFYAFLSNKRSNVIKNILIKQFSHGTKSREYNLWQLFVKLPTFYWELPLCSCKYESFIICYLRHSACNPCFGNVFRHRTVQLNGWHFSMLNLWLNYNQFYPISFQSVYTINTNKMESHHFWCHSVQNRKKNKNQCSLCK